jgi:exosortase H (IPTLxxWG-CTERM-specific)
MPKHPKPAERQETSKSQVRRFLLIFLGIVGAYYALTLVLWVDGNILYPLLQLSAQASSLLLNLTGENTTTKGIVIQGATFAVAVRRGCDPLEPIALFGAAVIAFPAPWRPKVMGLAIGAALLFTLNMLRIASLYWLGKCKSGWFETVHLELWPAFFILVSLSMWVLWLIWIRRTKPRYA